MDGQGTGAEERDRSAFHQYRPASRGRGRKGGTEGFTGGFFGTEYGPMNLLRTGRPVGPTAQGWNRDGSPTATVISRVDRSKPEP